MEQVDSLVDLIGSILLLKSCLTSGIDLIEGAIVIKRRGLYKKAILAVAICCQR